ncbi:MAG: histidine phosphatase family protein [Pirellulales bacterium]|nr:histidine phosphatase family protein [Pirellulales bacterium]
MRIGLRRHFPIDERPSGWRTAAELVAWRDSYDQAGAIVGAADLGSGGWQACLSSDLPRTLITAQTVFSGPIEATPLLREAQFTPFGTGGLRLPVWAWQLVLRGAWMTGHRSQRACRDNFRERVLTVVERLCGQEVDTLVVSHAGMMAYLSAELRRRGFVGPRLRIARHATVYAYENRPEGRG